MLPLIFDDTTKKAKHKENVRANGGNAQANAANNNDNEEDDTEEKQLTTKPVRENVMSAFY